MKFKEIEEIESLISAVLPNNYRYVRKYDGHDYISNVHYVCGYVIDDKRTVPIHESFNIYTNKVRIWKNNGTQQSMSFSYVYPISDPDNARFVTDLTEQINNIIKENEDKI